MPSAISPKRHIGIYAYRVSLLQQFVGWPVAPLEACEKLEQLRILANGQAIHVAEAVEAGRAVWIPSWILSVCASIWRS